MFSIIFCLVMCVSYIVMSTASPPHYIRKTNVRPYSCTMLKVSVLSTIHGGAFNNRYMSIRQPELVDDNGDQVSIKRAATGPWGLSDSSIESGPKYTTYAWDAPRSFDIGRLKRARSRVKPPWDCGEVVEWIDLGYNYFPRYLRSVRCSCETCWYNSYVCKPRSFPINVLRKRTDECVQVPNKLHEYLEVKSGEFVEAWIWEEQYVNVNCECVWSPGKN